MCKRPLQDSGASVRKRQRTSSRTVTDIGDLVFLFFTAASCSGLCQGCDLCHPEVCDDPKEANAIKKDGIIYKQVGHGFDLTFASLTCLFIRMYASFKSNSTPTAKHDHRGRSVVSITYDNGKVFRTQALKFASLAWDKLTPAAKLGTAGMPLRDFKRAFPVDHIDGNPSNNDVSNGMIMTKAEHDAKTKNDAKTKKSAAQRAKQAMSKSAPCTMTVFDLEGKPLNDSEGKPIVKNYDHRKEVMDDYKLTSDDIANSIKREDSPTRKSLVKINYNGQDCLAQFSWYDLPDLVDDDGKVEIWKPVTEADHKFLGVKMSEIYEYFVSNMERFKTVTKSTQNAKIRDFRGQERPRIQFIGTHLFFHRVVALVFHREQMDKYIAEQYAKTGIVWTFATLEVDHIDFDPENHRADNLQFLTPQKNQARSHNRPCIIWEIGKKDAETEYPSVVAAAKEMGCSDTTVHRILKNNKHEKWRGEYI